MMTGKALRPALAGALLLLAAAACAGQTTQPAAHTPPAGAQIAAPAPAPSGEASPPRSTDPTLLPPVDAAIARLLALRTFRASLVSETPGGDRIEGEFAYMAPDRFHVSVVSGVPFEVISLGRLSYVKAGGPWQQTEPSFMPFSAAEVLARLSASASGAYVASGQGATGCEIYRPQSGGAAVEFCVVGGEALRAFAYTDGPTRVTVAFGDFDAAFEIKAP